MNRKQLLAAAALAVLGTTSAFAGGEFDPMTGFGPVGQSTLTRAEVRADYIRARDGGEMVSFDTGTEYAQAPKFKSTLTREQVKTEFARARDNGEMVSFDTGTEYAQAPKASSTLSREQVREETRLALKSRRTVEGS
jgi:hypothetical protein